MGKTRRENGSGTLPVQEENGRWSLKVSYRDVESGEPKRTTIRGVSQGEVIQKKKDFLKAIDLGTRPEAKKITLEKWLDTWLEANKKGTVENTSYRRYKTIVKNHIKDSTLGKISLDKLARADIQKFFNEKALILKPRTLTLIRVIISDALKVAELDNLILRNPCKVIKLPKAEPREVQPLNPEEVKLLLAVADPGSMMHAIIFTALRTGMREGEILGLRWQDINFKVGTIAVKQQAKVDRTEAECLILGRLKTASSYRTIPLEKQLAEVLKSHKANQAKEKLAAGEIYAKHNLVFAWEDGNIMHPNTMAGRFERIVKKSGIQKRTFHELRHTFASIGISKGLSIKTVSKILGHAKIDITIDTYGHLMPGDMESVIDAVAAFYDG